MKNIKLVIYKINKDYRKYQIIIIVILLLLYYHCLFIILLLFAFIYSIFASLFSLF